jgi:1-acyl-sn-glycerol-3-phosphate acyltransferase
MRLLKSLIIWVAGILILILLFPVHFVIWLVVFPFDKKRVVMHWLLVFHGMLLARVISFRTIDVSGREKIVKGTTYVIISNHQSILDILLLYFVRYKFKWISKIENIKVPILGWYLKMADYIIIDRGNEESKVRMLEESYQCLKSGTSIMLFPEGTRSYDSKIGFFKRGAFQLAIQANIPVLPIIIDGTGSLLPKKGLIFGGGQTLRVRILDPVAPESFGTDKPDILAKNFQDEMIKKLEDFRSNDFKR